MVKLAFNRHQVQQAALNMGMSKFWASARIALAAFASAAQSANIEITTW
jgi:hypothetical protein